MKEEIWRKNRSMR